MFCQNCGNKLSNIEKFCSGCGTKIDNKGNNYNKKKLLLIVGCIIIFALVIALVLYFTLFKKEEISNSNAEEVVQVDYFSDVLSVLQDDLESNKISSDEYVQQLLYIMYDKSLAKEEYRTANPVENGIHIEEVIDKYYDELSDDTLQYFIEKAMLSFVTFDLEESTEESALADFFVQDVYAEDKVTNLNKAVLSSNGNFVVWYTTTGDSKTNKKAAQKVADGLDETVKEYERLFGKTYRYHSERLQGSLSNVKYLSQKKVLEQMNIDPKYLDEAMQVYLTEYNSDGLAQYLGGNGLFWDLIYSQLGGDNYGSILTPYSLIKPSSFSDFERLEQLYNHELFHHFQYYVLCGEEQCSVNDPFIGEATANWSSSLVSPETSNDGYLNEWAGTARSFSNNLMGEKLEEHGATQIGYAMFVYLNIYQETVYNGLNKIIESIYQEDSLKYLEDNATEEELSKIQSKIALKNLTQDYENNNLIGHSDWKEPSIEKTISGSYSIDDNKLYPMAIEYYLINKDYTANFSLEVTGENSYLYLIAKNGKKYDVVDTVNLSTIKQTILTKNYEKYDSLYLAFSNYSLKNESSYSLEIVFNGDRLIENEIKFDTDIDNYNLSITGEVAMSVNGMDVNMDLDITGTIDEKHQKEYLKMNTTTMGMVVSTEIYKDLASGVSYTKIPFVNSWQEEQEASSIIDLTKILDKFNESGSVTKVKENQYKVKFSKNEIINLIATTTSSVDTSILTGGISADVYLENGYIKKMEYDFSSLSNLFDKFNMTIVFSDYNKANDVEIPVLVTEK